MLEAFRSAKSYKTAGFLGYPVAIIICLINKYIMIGMGVLLGMIPLTLLYCLYGVFFIASVKKAREEFVSTIETNIIADIGFILGACVTVIFLFGLLMFCGFVICDFLGVGN